MNKFNFDATQALSREQMKKISGSSLPTCRGECTDPNNPSVCDADPGADCYCDDFSTVEGPLYFCAA